MACQTFEFQRGNAEVDREDERIRHDRHESASLPPIPSIIQGLIVWLRLPRTQNGGRIGHDGERVAGATGYGRRFLLGHKDDR